MFVGHLAVGLVAERIEPKLSLGTGVLAAMLVDLHLLTLAWYNNIAGPPPRNPHTAPIVSLIFFSLVVAWAYWMNRLRPAHAG